jgi:crotonobetainyl-CoA:carnitine CoA-transferase CaiB-like acyl-CoA transferase
MERLQRFGVPAGAVLNAGELMTNPHLLERGFFWEIDHPEAGRFLYCGLPIRFSKASPSDRRPAPCMGEHNRAILNGLLGFSDDYIDELEKKGIIGAEPIAQ